MKHKNKQNFSSFSQRKPREKTQLYNSDFYGPAEFKNVEVGPARAVAGINKNRIIIDGKMAINYVKSSKWGEEVHIQVYAPEHKIEKRNPSKWSRTEIYFPISHLKDLIEALIKLEIEANASKNKPNFT